MCGFYASQLKNAIALSEAKSYTFSKKPGLTYNTAPSRVLQFIHSRRGGAVDIDAFEAYFVANSPVTPGPQNRITRIP